MGGPKPRARPRAGSAVQWVGRPSGATPSSLQPRQSTRACAAKKYLGFRPSRLVRYCRFRCFAAVVGLLVGRGRIVTDEGTIDVRQFGGPMRGQALPGALRAGVCVAALLAIAVAAVAQDAPYQCTQGFVKRLMATTDGHRMKM